MEVALENALLCLQGFEGEEVQNELDDLNHEIKYEFSNISVRLSCTSWPSRTQMNSKVE